MRNEHAGELLAILQRANPNVSPDDIQVKVYVDPAAPEVIHRVGEHINGMYQTRSMTITELDNAEHHTCMGDPSLLVHLVTDTRLARAAAKIERFTACIRHWLDEHAAFPSSDFRHFANGMRLLSIQMDYEVGILINQMTGTEYDSAAASAVTAARDEFAATSATFFNRPSVKEEILRQSREAGLITDGFFVDQRTCLIAVDPTPLITGGKIWDQADEIAVAVLTAWNHKGYGVTGPIELPIWAAMILCGHPAGIVRSALHCDETPEDLGAARSLWSPNPDDLYHDLERCIRAAQMV